MDKMMKTVLDFRAVINIEDIIQKWAEKSGFRENTIPIQLGSDDVAYCFTLDDDDTRTILTINILDSMLHLEAWTLCSISNKTIPKENINSLLKILGQPNIK